MRKNAPLRERLCATLRTSLPKAGEAIVSVNDIRRVKRKGKITSDGLRVEASRTVDCRRVEKRLSLCCEGCRPLDGLQKLLSALS